MTDPADPTDPLFVYFEDRLVGRLVADDAQRLTFTYERAWCQASDALALSLTMPCRAEPYVYPVAQNFFENLLPEERIRRAMERGFKLPAESPYQFLKEFGDDLAGAFSIRKTLESRPAANAAGLKEVPWDYVDQAIDDGRQLYTAVAHDFGAKFSLAGAQDKFVVVYDEPADKIYVVTDGAPTTHILKVDLAFKNSQTVFNEFFCLDLARRIGLPTAVATVRVGGHPKLLIERYDRIMLDKKMRRLHQEDLCQALGQPSSLKYEDKGGKSFGAYFELVRANSRRPIQDLELLLQWLCFNLVIGNNDAHGKNLAFLYMTSKPDLAPFYDLLSTVIYPDYDKNMSFSIGGTFHYRALRHTHFEAAAKVLGVRLDRLLRTFRQMVTQVEAVIDDSVAALKKIDGKATVGGRIAAEVRKRITHFRVASDLLGPSAPAKTKS